MDEIEKPLKNYSYKNATMSILMAIFGIGGVAMIAYIFLYRYSELGGGIETILVLVIVGIASAFLFYSGCMSYFSNNTLIFYEDRIVIPQFELGVNKTIYYDEISNFQESFEQNGKALVIYYKNNKKREIIMSVMLETEVYISDMIDLLEDKVQNKVELIETKIAKAVRYGVYAITVPMLGFLGYEGYTNLSGTGLYLAVAGIVLFGVFCWAADKYYKDYYDNQEKNPEIFKTKEYRKLYKNALGLTLVYVFGCLGLALFFLRGLGLIELMNWAVTIPMIASFFIVAYYIIFLLTKQFKKYNTTFTYHFSIALMSFLSLIPGYTGLLYANDKISYEKIDTITFERAKIDNNKRNCKYRSFVVKTKDPKYKYLEERIYHFDHRCMSVKDIVAYKGSLGIEVIGCHSSNNRTVANK